MPTIPSESELYEEFRATVAGDAETNLVDYSPGSVLDTMAGTVATAARAIMRWMLRLVATAFVSTSDGSDLDFVIADRVDLTRNPGESDDAFRARYLAFITALARGTEFAWRYFLGNEVEGVNTATFTIVEDLEAGLVTITIQPLSGYTEAEIKATADSLKDDWRVFGGPYPNVETIPE